MTINKINSGSLQSCKKCEKQWCNCKLTKELLDNPDNSDTKK